MHCSSFAMYDNELNVEGYSEERRQFQSTVRNRKSVGSIYFNQWPFSIPRFWKSTIEKPIYHWAEFYARSGIFFVFFTLVQHESEQSKKKSAPRAKQPLVLCCLKSRVLFHVHQCNCMSHRVKMCCYIYSTFGRIQNLTQTFTCIILKLTGLLLL